ACQRPLRFSFRARLRRSVRVRRDKPAQWCRVQVPDSEGPANHTGPVSCAGVGNGAGEALTGEHAGRVWSPEIAGRPGCRRAPNTRKALLSTPFWPGGDGPGGVEDLWHASKHCVRNPGDPASGLTRDRQVRTVNLRGTTVVHGCRESDSCIV